MSPTTLNNPSSIFGLTRIFTQNGQHVSSTYLESMQDIDTHLMNLPVAKYVIMTSGQTFHRKGGQ